MKYTVLYPDGNTKRRETIEAASMDVERGCLVFYDRHGLVLNAFKDWLRIDRVNS